jgi:hypothetical protein
MAAQQDLCKESNEVCLKITAIVTTFELGFSKVQIWISPGKKIAGFDRSLIVNAA